MRAADVMTTSVITISPQASVQELARLLADHGISGAPVVNADGKLVGIVSEGDLLHRVELGTERHPDRRRRRSWWLEMVASERQAAAQDYIKSHGQTVADIMTRDVVTVSEDTPLSGVAALLEEKRIKRVPVVHDGKVVGIISRANLVRALAAAPLPAGLSNETDDRQIRQKLLAELTAQEWARVWPQDIHVQDGVVHFWLPDDLPRAEIDAMRIAAQNVAGVREVKLHLMTIPPPMTAL
jgi:CBS domain-containing protein